MVKKIILTAAAILLSMGLLAGCGGQPNTETAAETSSAEEAASVAQTTAATTPETETADLSQYAGEYVFYGTFLNDNYVTIDALEGTSTVLEADGSGYLNWGENNNGPITEWAVVDGSIQIKAGISNITGIIKEGILILSIGDPGSEFLECYVTKDADTSDMPQITAEEWADMIADTIE